MSKQLPEHPDEEQLKKQAKDLLREIRTGQPEAVARIGNEKPETFALHDAQRVIARERLIELSRTRLGDSSDRSVDVLISRLRRKLSSAGKPAPIITVRGIGYMLNVPVERR